MKKIDQKTLEKFAKEKNIDKNKVEKIAEGYKNKSDSIMTKINNAEVQEKVKKNAKKTKNINKPENTKQSSPSTSKKKVKKVKKVKKSSHHTGDTN